MASFFFLLLHLLLLFNPTLQQSTNYSGQINSNSVLVALLDSHYTELSELVEKALLLQTLEDEIGKNNITIFAPKNEALERDLDPEFKRFLLEPGNLRTLQNLLLHHIVPKRIELSQTAESTESTLGEDRVELKNGESGSVFVGNARVLHPNAVDRPDGVIHGIERLLIPRSVQQDFNNRRNLGSISAVKPEGAPEIDPRTNRLKKPAPVTKPGSSPALPISYAM